MSYWCSLVNSLSKAPSTETIWTVLAILASALIAVVAAYVSARLTMKNARMLQDRERRHDEKSVAAVLCADLERKLVDLVLVLSTAKHSGLMTLGMTGISTSVLEAVLPKLGVLGSQKARGLIGAVDRIPNLMRLARIAGNEQDLDEYVPQVRDAAIHIGMAVRMLLDEYELERPIPLENTLPNLDLEAIGLKKIKDLGL